jgi:hypothetical protein
MIKKIAVVIPNWDGEDMLAQCVDSLLAQTLPCTVIVVDNGSVDSSRDTMKSYGDKIICLYNQTNLGFTGGVNPGMQYAIDHDFDAVALLNNDAVADKDWLQNLAASMKGDIGMVTCSLQSFDGKKIDSTGDQLTVWGLPYPRGRGKLVKDTDYTQESLVFGASGGATLFSIDMLREIGLYDNDFFAYYEDTDLSFRAQLAGWKVLYQPKAKVFHMIGATSSRHKGFTVYQTFKNMPMVLTKNVPKGLRHIILPRFYLAYASFFISALGRGQGWVAFKGYCKFLSLYSTKLRQRRIIQAGKKVSNDHIFSILTHDLPENSHKLRKLRALWRKLTGRK